MWLSPSSDEKNCLNYKKVKSYSYKGVITDKYFDIKNHNYPILVINETREIDVINDISGLFNYVRINDEVEKKSDSYEFTITRDKKQTIFVLDYGCQR